MAPELKSKKRKATIAADDEIEIPRKEKKATLDVPAKKRKTAENGTSEATKKLKTTKAVPVVEPSKPEATKKTAAITKPIVSDKPEEKKAKKAKVDKPLSENKKKLKEMKDAPDVEAEALKQKEKKEKKNESTKAPVEVDGMEESDIEVDDQTEELLKGFESATDDEKDPEDQEYKGEPIPKLNKKAKSKLAKLAAKQEASAGPGTVYLGRIPHGFYEHEMKQYFKQFGDITKLRLSRNRKTGNSKHYAFIQFASGDVAEIVSKTMDNYLLFGHILKCKVVPEEQIHAGLWEGANKRFKKVPWNKMEGRKLEMGLDEAGWDKRNEKEAKRREEKAEKMKALGYEFEAPKLKSAKGIPKRPREPLVIAAELEEEVAEETEVSEPVKPVKAAKESKRKTKTIETEEANVPEPVKPAKPAKVSKRKAEATETETQEVKVPEPVKPSKPAKVSKRKAETTETEEVKVPEPVEPAKPAKESKRKAEATEIEEPSKKKQKKLKAKASSDKLAAAANTAKPTTKPAAEVTVDTPAVEKIVKTKKIVEEKSAAEKKTTKVKKSLDEKADKSEKADKPAKKAKKTKA